MEEKYIAAIDLGSSQITLSVAKISGEDIQILYYKKTPSDGIRNSAVFNPGKATGPIKAAIEEAERELKIKILQVVVGLPRCDIRQETSKAKVERSNPDESIVKEEVENLKSLALNDYPLQNPEQEIIYGAIAQSFSDDEQFQLIESDIIGVISRNFEGNFKLFIGKSSYVRTIDKLFNGLGIAIAKKYFTPISQAKVVLTSDEIASGVALIDIGGGATSVTIYKDNILRHYASIPFGGNVITRDIMNECRVNEKLAENIKLAFGACIPEKLQTLGEKIIQIEGEEFGGFKQIPVKYLSEVITARVKEIADAIFYEMQQSGLADSLRGGVVLTGGGAELTNIALYIKDLSGYNVRIGYPRKKFSASGQNGIFEPNSSTSLGMILSAKEDELTSCLDKPVAPKVENENPFIEVDKESEEVQGDGQLFTDDEVPVEERQKESQKKPKKNKTGFLKVTWDKLINFVDDMSKDISDDQNV